MLSTISVGAPPFVMVGHQGGLPGSITCMASGPSNADLKSIWLFSSCTATELRKIRASLDATSVPAGKVLVEEGSLGREFFIIVEGTAAVTRNGKKITTLGPGNHFGEMAMLDRRPRSATVTSETGMDLLVMSQRQFSGLLESVPTIALKMLSALATRLREVDAIAFG